LPAPRLLIAKEELFHNKIAAFFLFRLHARPIKRGTADLGSIRLALQILSHDPCFFFPGQPQFSLR